MISAQLEGILDTVETTTIKAKAWITLRPRILNAERIF